MGSASKTCFETQSSEGVDLGKKHGNGAPKLIDTLRKEEAKLIGQQKKLVMNLIEQEIAEAAYDGGLKKINAKISDIRQRIQEQIGLLGVKSAEDRAKNFVTAMTKVANRRDACNKALAAVYVTRTDDAKGRYAKARIDVRIVPR